MSDRIEKVEDILPRIRLDRREPADEVEEVRQLAFEANQANDEFLRAGLAFACLAQQIAELQTELLQAALDMHSAKCRADKAVAAVKAKAGLV